MATRKARARLQEQEIGHPTHSCSPQGEQENLGKAKGCLLLFAILMVIAVFSDRGTPTEAPAFEAVQGSPTPADEDSYGWLNQLHPASPDLIDLTAHPVQRRVIRAIGYLGACNGLDPELELSGLGGENLDGWVAWLVHVEQLNGDQLSMQLAASPRQKGKPFLILHIHSTVGDAADFQPYLGKPLVVDGLVTGITDRNHYDPQAKAIRIMVAAESFSPYNPGTYVPPKDIRGTSIFRVAELAGLVYRDCRSKGSWGLTKEGEDRLSELTLAFCVPKPQLAELSQALRLFNLTREWEPPSIPHLRGYEHAIDAGRLTSTQLKVLQAGQALHFAFKANPGLLPAEDDALQVTTARALQATVEFLAISYRAYTQYQADGGGSPSPKTASLVSVAWGLEG